MIPYCVCPASAAGFGPVSFGFPAPQDDARMRPSHDQHVEHWHCFRAGLEAAHQHASLPSHFCCTCPCAADDRSIVSTSGRAADSVSHSPDEVSVPANPEQGERRRAEKTSWHLDAAVMNLPLGIIEHLAARALWRLSIIGSQVPQD